MGAPIEHDLPLGWRTDLMARRLGGSAIITHGDAIVVRTPANPEFHWGNALVVRSDLGDARRWSDLQRELFPDVGHDAVGLAGPAAAAADAAPAWRVLGFEVDTAAVLALDGEPVPAPTPARTVLRALDGDADWRGLADLRAAMGYDPEDETPTYASRRLDEQRLSAGRPGCAWFGAFVDGELACALGVLGDGGPLVRYQSVETAPAFRRRGLARALVAHAGRWARQQTGARRLVIVAEADSVAHGLYRSLGFVDVGVQVQADRQRR